MWKDSYKCAALETQYMPISYACYLYEMYDFGISLHSLHNEKFLFISSIHRPFWITAYRSIIIDASFFSVSPPPPSLVILTLSLFTLSLSSYLSHSLQLFLCILIKQADCNPPPLSLSISMFTLFYSVPIRHANYNPSAKMLLGGCAFFFASAIYLPMYNRFLAKQNVLFTHFRHSIRNMFLSLCIFNTIDFLLVLVPR